MLDSNELGARRRALVKLRDELTGLVNASAEGVKPVDLDQPIGEAFQRLTTYVQDVADSFQRLVNDPSDLFVDFSRRLFAMAAIRFFATTHQER